MECHEQITGGAQMGSRPSSVIASERRYPRQSALGTP